jgi:hypothetical protein
VQQDRCQHRLSDPQSGRWISDFGIEPAGVVSKDPRPGDEARTELIGLDSTEEWVTTFVTRSSSRSSNNSDMPTVWPTTTSSRGRSPDRAAQTWPSSSAGEGQITPDSARSFHTI